MINHNQPFPLHSRHYGIASAFLKFGLPPRLGFKINSPFLKLRRGEPQVYPGNAPEETRSNYDAAYLKHSSWRLEVELGHKSNIISKLEGFKVRSKTSLFL